MDFTDDNAIIRTVEPSSFSFGTKRSQVQILSPRSVEGRDSEKSCGLLPFAEVERAAATGRRSGQQTKRPLFSQRQTPYHEARDCRACGKSFHPSCDAVARGGGWYCSPPCRSKSPRKRGVFITPESSKRQRIAANGLINMRLRRGWFSTPPHCQLCPKTKVDSHHLDYDKPEEVVWLCRGHHLRAHHNPTSVIHLPIFLCIDYRNHPGKLRAAIAKLYPPSSPSLAPKGEAR